MGKIEVFKDEVIHRYHNDVEFRAKVEQACHLLKRSSDLILIDDGEIPFSRWAISISLLLEEKRTNGKI